jgi:hypothetical protein
MAVMTDSNGTEKDGGLGAEGTIPAHLAGVAATLGEEGSNFNHEEDPESAASDDAVDETAPRDADGDEAAGGTDEARSAGTSS